jgi:hypothetical protein
VSVNVEVPDPGAAIDTGLKLAVTPLGSPLADSATALLNPPARVDVMVLVVLLPGAAATDVGVTAREKPVPVPAVTASVSEAVWVTPPPTPVTVTA